MYYIREAMAPFSRQELADGDWPGRSQTGVNGETRRAQAVGSRVVAQFLFSERPHDEPDGVEIDILGLGLGSRVMVSSVYTNES